MEKNKVRIDINSLILYLALFFSFLFIFPNDYKHFAEYGGLVLNILTIVFVTLAYIRFFPSIMKFFKKYFLFSVPFLVMVVASLLNENSVEGALASCSYLLIFYFIGGIFKKYKREIIMTAELVSFALLSINAAVMIFYGCPLAYTATAGRIFFIFEGSVGKLLAANILLFFIGGEQKLTKKALLHYVAYVASLYCIFSSATYFFCNLLLLLYMVFIKSNKRKSRLPRATIFYFALLVLINILVVSGLLSSSLSEIFDKSITLSGRTTIWSSAIEVVGKNPFVGIGNFDSDFFIDLTGVRGATHAHNQFLQILLNSGIIGFLVYAYYIYKIIRSSKYLKNDIFYTYYKRYLFVILIMGITTTSFDAFFNLSLLLMASYVDENNLRLIDKKKKVLGRKDFRLNEKNVVFR